jgi:hypothetical protein
MSPEELEQWARTRAKGRARFIWMNGVLGWGLTLAVIIPLVLSLIQGWQPVVRALPFGFIVFPIGGYVWGVRMWQLSERRYAETVGRDSGK